MHWFARQIQAVRPVLASAIACITLTVAGLATARVAAAVDSEPGETSATTELTGIERRIGAPSGPERSGAELEAVTDEVSAVLRCPVCQGMSVSDSPSASARDMKEEIRELLALGYSPEQVKSYFEGAYGEFVLLDPKAQGLNWLLWLAPGAAFLLGLGLVQRSRSRSSEPASADLDSYLEQVRSSVDGPAVSKAEPQ